MLKEQEAKGVKEKKPGKIVVVLLSVFLIIIICLLKQHNIIDLFTKREPSSLRLNDKVPEPEIEVVTLEGFNEKLSFINNRKKSLVFIINVSCAPCEKNIAIGERLYQQIRSEAAVVGLVKGGIPQATDIKEAFKVQFPLYVPSDISKFSKMFYTTSGSSLTILVTKDGKIEWAKSGDLNVDDYLNLKNIILKN
ncbi:MAG: hypothetical protein PHU81_03115 [Acidobacteriota bacterium]|nr:hypothetical protein [Acidobacteriota bacterium]